MYSNAEVWPLFEAAYEMALRNNHGKQPPRILLTFTNANCRRRGRYLGHVHCWEGLKLREGRPWNSAKGRYDHEGELQQWNHILCRIGKPGHWPFASETYYRFKDMDVYPVHDYKEGIIHIIAHEMQHAFGTRGGKEGEIQCELAAQDALDYYRKNKQAIDDKMVAGMFKDVVRHQKAKEKAKGPSTEEKAEKALRSLKKWETKAKLAATKIKHYNRIISRLSRQM